MTSNRLPLSGVILATAAGCILVFASHSPAHSTVSTATTQEPQSKQATPDCDIDGSFDWKYCPPETIIRQYREKYDLTAALRGGSWFLVFSNEYLNELYSYKVSLPLGVEALADLPPAPWHGFIVNVANELKPGSAPESADTFWSNWKTRLCVYGEYNSLEYASVDEAADATLRHKETDHSDNVVIQKRVRTTLGELPAVRQVVRYFDSKTGETMIADSTRALSENWGVVYGIDLETTAARYAEHQKILKQLIRGFHTIRTEPE